MTFKPGNPKGQKDVKPVTTDPAAGVKKIMFLKGLGGTEPLERPRTLNPTRSVYGGREFSPAMALDPRQPATPVDGGKGFDWKLNPLERGYGMMNKLPMPVRESDVSDPKPLDRRGERGYPPAIVVDPRQPAAPVDIRRKSGWKYDSKPSIKLKEFRNPPLRTLSVEESREKLRLLGIGVREEDVNVDLDERDRPIDSTGARRVDSFGNRPTYLSNLLHEKNLPKPEGSESRRSEYGDFLIREGQRLGRIKGLNPGTLDPQFERDILFALTIVARVDAHARTRYPPRSPDSPDFRNLSLIREPSPKLELMNKLPTQPTPLSFLSKLIKILPSPFKKSKKDPVSFGYLEAPMELLTIAGEPTAENAHAIARSYMGWRVSWFVATGSFMVMKDNDIPELGGTKVNAPLDTISGLMQRGFTARFKLELVAKAKESPQSEEAKFIRAHAKEMGIVL
ncbi:MAG: hypothetical protein Q7S22_07230 [Candidatus Micrarchaeota archaeon]|nr:hypothetical protein [Candidatus Micrarchaeota archaeon]